MPILAPYIQTPQEIHEDSLWVREECYRFYVQERRLNCTFMELLDLWLQAPYCLDCALSDPFEGDRDPDIIPMNWEEDLAWKLGQDTLDETKKILNKDPRFAFVCKRCGKELRAWENDELYVVNYHLEENYGIALETPGRQQPSRKLKKQILKLYDNRCFGCGCIDRPLHIDHIVPRSKGGDAAFRNVQSLCEDCGNNKGDRLPEEVIVYSTIYFGPYPSDGYDGLFW